MGSVHEAEEEAQQVQQATKKLSNTFKQQLYGVLREEAAEVEVEVEAGLPLLLLVAERFLRSWL